MLAFTSPQRHYPAYTYPGSMYGRQPPRSPDMGGDSFRERIRELAEQRARKDQWLPDEADDSDEELDYSHLGPHERRYIEAMKTQRSMDRVRKNYEVRATAMQEEAERLRRVEEERARKLEKRQMEVQDARQRTVEQLYREASERRVERDANLRAEHMRKRNQHDAFLAGRNHSQSRQHGSSSIPINPEGTPLSPTPHNANPVPEPKSQPPLKPLYTEKHETAASVIQERFRIHRSLHTISTIASEFKLLKNSFAYPSVIDFQEPGTEGGHISISTARVPSEFDNVEEDREDEGEAQMEVDGPQVKLAYTAVNYPVHSYVDAMERLLMKLDGVESWGNKGVRERRRSVVKEIGKETAKLERFWKQAWVDYVEKQGDGVREEEEQEVQVELQEKMEIDGEPVHVELPKVEENRDSDDEWLDVAELAPVVPNDSGVEVEESPNALSTFTEPITSRISSTPSTLSDDAEVVEL